MKKLLFIATLIFAISCSKDNGKLDPSAVVSIRPAASSQLTTKASPYLSNKEIVKQADDISWYANYQTSSVLRGFAPTQRDTINIRLLMWSVDIINQYGEYETAFIEGRDFVIRRIINKGQWPVLYDTIAYIPQNVIIYARNAIKLAYDAKEFSRCYELFDNAFTFKQITGPEWRELKKQGLN